MTKILIAEDSEILRFELKKFLVREGHEVIEAVDGSEGVKKAQENPDIDFIISDYNMPNLTGVEMLQEIKKLSDHNSTPSVILTTETSYDLQEKGKAIGIMMWVIKPFQEKVIKKLITRAAS